MSRLIAYWRIKLLFFAVVVKLRNFTHRCYNAIFPLAVCRYGFVYSKEIEMFLFYDIFVENNGTTLCSIALAALSTKWKLIIFEGILNAKCKSFWYLKHEDDSGRRNFRTNRTCENTYDVKNEPTARLADWISASRYRCDGWHTCQRY